MKLESLVIVDQNATVNTFSGLVHTARHGMEIDSAVRWCANCKEVAIHGGVGDWVEVVTR